LSSLIFVVFQIKIGIPLYLQRLVYNGKGLLDDKTLLYYNIEKESNLRLYLKTWNGSSGIPGVSLGPSFDWDNLANSAKSKVDEEIAEKKLVYETLMREKEEEHRNLEKIKAELRHHEVVELEALEQILVKDKEIQSHEQKLREVHELLLTSKREMSCLKGQKDLACLKRSRKREEMATFQLSK
jgi:hypothetical protein